MKRILTMTALVLMSAMAIAQAVSNSIWPTVDNTYDIGLPNSRFKNYYMTGKLVLNGYAIISSEGNNFNFNTFIGYEAGKVNTGSQNSFFGASAGLSNTTGAFNTFIGYYSGKQNTTGGFNTFIGHSAGGSNVSGNDNVFVGTAAGQLATGSSNSFFGRTVGGWVTTGSNNSYFGYQSGGGVAAGTGSNNSFFGSNSGLNSTQSNGNSFFGSSAGQNLTAAENTSIGANSGSGTSGGFNAYVGYGSGKSGSNNSFLGYKAGFINTGDNNSFIGYQSGYSSTGLNNSFVGYQSGYNNGFGSNNVFIGASSGYSNTSAWGNTFVGNSSGKSNSTGSNNTCLGLDAGNNAGTVHNYSNSVFIGTLARPTANALSNVVAIGYNAQTAVSNAFILGNNTHNVGIRQNTPVYPLHVYNAYTDGSTWFNASDKNLKSNFARIAEDESILAKVMELPVQYWTYKSDSSGARHIGPVSQDFHKVFRLGGNEKSIASVDQFGIAIAAIQELNKKMQKLEALAKDQQQVIANMLNAALEKSEPIKRESNRGLQLYQNAPNPFKQNAEIKMEIPDGVIDAVLYIYDLQGRQVERHNVTKRGVSSVFIEGGKLSAGMYLYTLVTDGESVGVRRMILTE